MAKNNEAAELSIEKVREEIAEMLAAARAEAEKIMNSARKAAGVETEEEKAKKMAEDKARGEELVWVKLFKDTGRYKDDVFVGCNGESIAIQRGERVQIKRKFAEILDNSEHQDYETAQFIEKKSGEWTEKSNSAFF